MNGNIYLSKKDTFSEFEKSSSGWFYGRMSPMQNIYTWIKLNDAGDTIYITNNITCDLNLHPEKYELSSLNEGNIYYIDRDYILSTVPDEYKGYNMIKTANDDKTNINLDFHFNLCSSTDVYIAYDHRISTPSWITSNYDNKSERIYVTDANLEYFNIWKRKQPVTAGCYYFWR